jgi:hypothetical protein
MSEGLYRRWMVLLAGTAVVLLAVFVVGSLVLQARAAENVRYRQFELSAEHWGSGNMTSHADPAVFDTRTGTKRRLQE